MDINQSLFFSVESNEKTAKSNLIRASSALVKLQKFALSDEQEMYGLRNLSTSLMFTQSSLSANMGVSQLSLQLEEESSGTGKISIYNAMQPMLAFSHYTIADRSTEENWSILVGCP